MSRPKPKVVSMDTIERTLVARHYRRVDGVKAMIRDVNERAAAAELSFRSPRRREISSVWKREDDRGLYDVCYVLAGRVPLIFIDNRGAKLYVRTIPAGRYCHG